MATDAGSQQHSCVVPDSPQNPHEGEMVTCDGYWFCWKHYQQYNTDGVVFDGRLRKAAEGDNPWHNQI